MGTAAQLVGQPDLEDLAIRLQQQQQPPPAAYAQPGNPALAALAGAPQPGVPGAGGTSEFTAAGQSWQPPDGQEHDPNRPL